MRSLPKVKQSGTNHYSTFACYYVSSGVPINCNDVDEILTKKSINNDSIRADFTELFKGGDMMISSKILLFKRLKRLTGTVSFFILCILLLTACSVTEEVPPSTISTATLPSTHTNIPDKTSIPIIESTTTPSHTSTATVEPTPILNEGWGGRYEEYLDGTWEFVKVESLDDPLPTSGWEQIEVPSQFEAISYERAWYRRGFWVDRSWEGKRLSIRFGGIKYNSIIYINGIEVGGCFNGHEPFDVDITDAVVFGGENQILISVHDYTGLFSSPVHPSEGFSYSDIHLVENRLLSPIGTDANAMSYGVWDSVFLRVTEPVYVSDLFIQALVSESKLNIDISVTNSLVENTQVVVTARVFPWLGAARNDANQWPLEGNAVLISEGQDLLIPPNQTETIKISFNDPSLALWTPFEPNLYILEISLGKTGHDAERVRFGYREISVEGPDFYLNGQKIHLLTVAWFDNIAPDTHRIRQELLEIRTMNVNTIRTYDQQFGIYYELADEIGILMIPQIDVGNGEYTYRLRDPVFWHNYQQHILGRVERLKNHPSIIMWSLSAEFYHESLRGDQAVIDQLANLAGPTREVDGTRPLVYSMDGDPGGAADVVGYHYPNEPNHFPDQRYWPAAAYWADKPVMRPLDWFYESSFTFWDSDAFFWDRNKPLYIGEQHSFDGTDPARLTLFVGDEAYLPFLHQYYPWTWYEQPLYKAKAFAFEMQILASRQQGVSGFTMWGEFKSWSEGRTMLHEDNPEWVVMREMNQPLAAYLAEYDNRFFSGETRSRTIALFNDTMQTQPAVTFKWSLLSGGTVLSEGLETFTMPSGDIREHDLILTMPRVEERTEIILRLQMIVDEIIRFEKDYTLVVFPNLEEWKIPHRGIALYDPDKSLLNLWGEEEDFLMLETLEEWDGGKILILGKNATSGIPLETLLELRDKVQKGGRVLAIEQDVSIGTVLPVTFTGFGSSIAFLQTPSHPIVTNFEPEDFRWWRGDLLVSYADPVRTGIAGMTHLVASGSMKGMNSSPLLELKQGQGHWILSQLAVLSKLDEEPVAPHLLQAMLNYLDSLPHTERKILLSDSTGEIQKSELFLEIDWQVNDLNNQEFDLSSTDVFILHKDFDGLENHLKKLDQFLTTGGILLLDQPEPDIFTQLADYWDLPIEMHPYSGAAFLNSHNLSENAQGLYREDFLWLTETEPFNLIESAMASGAAQSVFFPKNVNISNWTPMGTLPGANARFGDVWGWDNNVVFFSNDLIEWDVTIPESISNQHIICLRALTNYEGDDPPQTAIWVDEQLAGIIIITSSRKNEHCVWTQNIQPGNRRLGIEYINRNSDPTEFKQIEIYSLAIQPIDNLADIKMISNPTSLISIPIGEGELIINGIQWQQGGWRGQRFLAGLLTSLGAGWKPGNSPIVIEGEDMQVSAWHPWYSQNTDHAWLVNDATLSDQVTIPADGIYKIVLLGRGLPLHGKYPVFQIYFDGVYQGQIEIQSDHWQFHSLDLPLSKGEYTLSLVFGNNNFDFQLGYGREVWIDQVRIYQD